MKRTFTKTITFHAPLTSISTNWTGGKNGPAASSGAPSKPTVAVGSSPIGYRAAGVAAVNRGHLAATNLAATNVAASDVAASDKGNSDVAVPPSGSQPAPPPQPPPADLKLLLSDLASSLDELNDARASNIEELREIAIELSVAIASHIVREKLDADEMDVSGLVSAAIEKLIPCETIQVRVHPQDLSAVREVITSEHMESAGMLDFQADPELPRGSCFVSGDGHGFVSTLDDRLENIRETLLQGIEHARIERRKADGFGTQLRRFPDRRKFA